MKIIDLFSGVGGLSLGFEWAGFESVAAIDFWDDAIKTYNHNRLNKVGMTIDIKKFNDDVLPTILKKKTKLMALLEVHLAKVLVQLGYRMQQIKFMK